MACRLINAKTGEEVPIKDKDTILDTFRWYEFDSGEEALLELALGKRMFQLADKTIHALTTVWHPLKHRGVTIPNHYKWRNYIFSTLGRFYSYVGEMRPVDNTAVTKPNLSQVDWKYYSFDERAKHFEAIYYSFGFKYENIIQDTTPIQPIKEYNGTTHIQLPSEPTYRQRAIREVVKEKHFVYLLFCVDTPKIYYVGRTKYPQQRFQAHLKNIKDQNSAPKYEWVEYIKVNGLKLEFKILEEETGYSIGGSESEYIRKYSKVKENVVLNFTVTPYTATNEIFLKRFNACLYEQKIIKVNDYYDITQKMESRYINGKPRKIGEKSQKKKTKTKKKELPNNMVKIIALTSEVTPNVGYLTHAFLATTNESIVERNLKMGIAIGDKRNKWIDEIKNKEGNLEVTELESCEKDDLHYRIRHYAKKYEKQGYDLVNSPQHIYR